MVKIPYNIKISIISIVSTSGIILLMLWALMTEFHASLERAKANSSFASELMAATIHRSLDDLTEVLIGIANAETLLDDEADKKQQQRLFDNLSVGIRERKPHIKLITVISPEGEVTLWNQPGTPPKISDRDYVVHHQRDWESQFYISSSLTSRIDGQKILVASLAARDELGILKGIIAVAISPEYFGAQFRGISQSKGLNLAVVTHNGARVWSNSNNYRLVNELEQSNHLRWQELPQMGSFDTWQTERFDGHYVGHYRLYRYPFVALSIGSLEQALAQWKQQSLLIIAAILMLMLMYSIIRRRLVKDHERLIATRDELAQIAMTDPLTGLSNRRHLWRQTQSLISSAKRYQFPLSVILLDIDHFKRVNDQYGHDMGDKVIQQVASSIRKDLRETDIACRFGGEEFALVLSHTNVEQAQQKAEQLRLAIKELTFQADTVQFSITISLGVAPLGDSIEAALQQADIALYRAKDEGRDRVVCSTLAHPKLVSNDG